MKRKKTAQLPPSFSFLYELQNCRVSISFPSKCCIFFDLPDNHTLFSCYLFVKFSLWCMVFINTEIYLTGITVVVVTSG